MTGKVGSIFVIQLFRLFDVLGAVDDRVIGIMPIVMDMLNFIPNLLHMYQSCKFTT